MPGRCIYVCGITAKSWRQNTSLGAGNCCPYVHVIVTYVQFELWLKHCFFKLLEIRTSCLLWSLPITGVILQFHFFVLCPMNCRLQSRSRVHLVWGEEYFDILNRHTVTSVTDRRADGQNGYRIMVSSQHR